MLLAGVLSSMRGVDRVKCEDTIGYSAEADAGYREGTIVTSVGGYGRGCAPSRDSQGVWGNAVSSPSGVWG